MKKHLLGKVFAGVITALTLFVNISCGDTPAGFGIDDTVKSDKVFIQPSISEGAARSVFPDVTLDKLEFIAFKYSRYNGEKHGTVAIYDNYRAFNGTKIALDVDDPTANKITATYDWFEVTAKCGNLLLSGKVIPSEPYEASAAAYPIEFNLSYSLTDEAFNSGKGDVLFVFDYSKDITVNEATAKLYKYESGKIGQYTYDTAYFKSEKSNEDGSHYISYACYDVPAGIYEMQFDIQATDSNNKIVYATYRNCIYVADGCETVENYNIKDAYWYDMYVVGSVMYSNESKHFKAEATPEGILITARYLPDDEGECNQINIVEEGTQVCIDLVDWVDSTNANAVPTAANPTVQVLYPFTKADKTYIFSFVRTRYDDREEEGEVHNFWDNSEKVIVKATHSAGKILDDDYENKLKRMSVSASSDSYTVKLNYDWRKLFDPGIEFDELKADGTIWAVGGKIKWVDETTNEVSRHVYHKWVGNRNYSWETGDIDLLTASGMSDYNQLMNGIAITDPGTIANIEKYGNYFVSAFLKFKLKGNPVEYKIHDIESEAYAKPETEMITVTFDSTVTEKTRSDLIVSKAYKKDSILELPVPFYAGVECSFAGWYTNADYEGSPISAYDCSEDITLYAKWNIQTNNWNYIYYNFARDDYFTNIIFDDIFADFNSTYEQDKPIIVTLEGTVLNDYTGRLAYSLVDRDNNGWERSADEVINNVSYKAGDVIKQDLVFIPYRDVARPGICIFVTNHDNRDLLELTDWSVSIDTEPVLFTLMNSVSNNPTTRYCHKNETVVLPAPEDYEEYGLRLNAWYAESDFTGDPITTVTVTEDTTVYAKMDICLKGYTWDDAETGDPVGHFVADFPLDYLRSIGCVDESFTAGYKLKKNDQVVLTFTGTPKNDFCKEFYLQVFDTNVNSYGSWYDNNAVVRAGEEFTVEIKTRITQTEFKTENPAMSIGYNLFGINGENSFSDWTISISLIKGEPKAILDIKSFDTDEDGRISLDVQNTEWYQGAEKDFELPSDVLALKKDDVLRIVYNIELDPGVRISFALRKVGGDWYNMAGIYDISESGVWNIFLTDDIVYGEGESYKLRIYYDKQGLEGETYQFTVN